MSDSVQEYMRLVNERPEWFLQPSAGTGMRLVLDESRIRSEEEKNGEKYGVMYDNSPYWIVLRDLVEPGYGYARVVYPAKTGGVVCIPVKDGKFCLLKIFRHGTRSYNGWEFPRGFNEGNLSVEDNARKELSEEILAGGAITGLRELGCICQDSGLCNGKAVVVIAQISDATAAKGHEGIDSLAWFSAAELCKMIRDRQIVDGFTLGAFALYMADRAGEGMEKDTEEHYAD